MATLVLVSECILALNDRTGSSLPAINKWILSEYKVSLFEKGMTVNRGLLVSKRFKIFLQRRI